MHASPESKENEWEAVSEDHWDLVDVVRYPCVLLNSLIFLVHHTICLVLWQNIVRQLSVNIKGRVQP